MVSRLKVQLGQDKPIRICCRISLEDKKFLDDWADYVSLKTGKKICLSDLIRTLIWEGQQEEKQYG